MSYSIQINGRTGLITLVALGCYLPVLAPDADAQAVGARSTTGGAVSPSLDEHERIVHLLQRATYGPLPADISAAAELGVDGWLERQLHPAGIADAAVTEALEDLPVLTMTVEELLHSFPPGEVLRPLRERLQEGDSLPAEERQRLRRELQRQSPQRMLGEMVMGRLIRASRSERQLQEVMTDFWFDHFNVFFQKGAVRWLVADYERSAIRPHVFGRFEDMLVATASHPAMLFYLDNWRSVAPDSSIVARNRRALMAESGRRRGERSADRRRPGLNENYARELLELHTLGVDGGYTQDDVVGLARVFTGWTMRRPGRNQRGSGRAAAQDQKRMGDEQMMEAAMARYEGAYAFQFRPELHDSGAKTVLDQAVAAGGGYDEGLSMLRMLARHPSTARHLATRLVERFVSDEPQPELVDHLAQVYLQTDGDLREVTRALFSSSEFYSPEHYRARVKSPYTLVASALRLTRSRVPNPRGSMEVLKAMGEAPYLAEPPTGYSEHSLDWVSSGSMLIRMNFGLGLATNSVPGARIGAQPLWNAARELRPDDPIAGLAQVLLPGADVEPLLRIVREDGAALGDAPILKRAQRALGLILGSPDFQRH